jgi:outer membrane protein assembly factor BamB
MLKKSALYLTLVLLIGMPRTGIADDGDIVLGQTATWPQWRGPHRNGQITNADTWPTKLDANHLKQSWRIPLSPSYSGPIVSETLVFITETKDKKTEIVRALDRITGAERWRAAWEGSMSVPFFAKSNGDWIRSTPAYDGECLYVGGMRDVLVCLDASTGAVRWRVDFVRDTGSELPAFGMVCSPLIDGAHLYVQAGGAVCKLEKSTGRIVWKALADAGGMMGSAFSSPFLADLGGRKQLLVQTREKLAGVDPESGTVLWAREIPAFRGMNILTPTAVGNSVFTSSYGGQSFLFNISADAQGSPMMSEAWTNPTKGYMSSPVVINGHIYLHLQNQRFTCLDMATGETKWTSKPYGKYWSLVANGENILALDERGELLLIRANPESFDLIDSRKISDDETWAHLAICEDQLFVRELNAIAAYRWQEPK